MPLTVSAMANCHRKAFEMVYGLPPNIAQLYIEESLQLDYNES